MFYIPSSDEIMQVSNSTDEKDLQQNSIASFTEMISESTIDQQVKEMVKLPIRKCGYKTEEGQKYHFRKIQFNEAYSYNTSAFKVLQYITLIYRIFQLEYIMGRNNSPGLDILELEDHILNGRNYWADKKDVFLLLENDDQQNLSASEKVINKIITQKKAKIDLAEDLKQIAERLHSINSWSKRYTIENLKIETMIDLLNLRHQQGFSHFLYGLESLLETYFDKKNEEIFNKMRQIKSSFIKRDRGFKMFNNGFSLNQSCINPLHMELRSPTLNDNEEFIKSYQAIIDEESLMPSQTEIIRRNYGTNSFIDSKNQEILLASYMKNYSNLDNCFFNVNDQERQYASTNFYQVDEAYKEYLQMMKGIYDQSQADQEVVLLAKIEMLNLKNESRHLLNILLTWNANGALPTDLNEYEKLLKVFKDQMMMKTLQERELLNEQQNKQRLANEIKKQTVYGIRVSKDIIQETLGYNVKEQHFNIKINERKAIINVFRKELDIRMIKQGIQMIKNEHSSLLAAFEHAATEKELHAFVHPQQQFASTLYQQVDRNSHLDVINKLSFVQSFLTRLRNRCTEVETLTSGPGIVFSMKDFNECLQIFCRGLLKYGEQELRTRVETQFLKEYQYQHMIYLKEQQCLYYRRKCEQFLTDIDKLINAKLSQKGNQIIYELDVANRELRMLKDNFYLMERLLRQEIKTEYEKTIQEKENTIQKFKQSFSVYKSELNNEIKEEVAKEIMSLDKKVKLIVDKRDNNVNASLRGVTQQLGNKLNQLRQNSLGMSSEQLLMQPQMGQKTGNYYKVESMREILSLHKFIRQYKVLTQMKEVLTQEKHERELHNQRQQLTSNACLWEQLAEAEKREQIMRQELYYTQQNLAQYEKLIEKLQTQLENLQNQKLRLQQYKNSKSKRIEELESKMREVEIIENIDLNKVLEELRQRDKKLHQLQAMDRNIQQKIEIVNKVNQKKVTVIEKKLTKEKDLKEQAFGKLESLRLEMRALEGKDYTSELWKDKCKELFEICKDLQKENDSLKVTLTQQGNQIQGQLQIIQNQNNQRSSGNNPFSPFSTTKDKQGFSLHSLDQTTKPSTAAAKFSQQSRLMSRGGGIGAGPQSHHGHILHTNAMNEQTLVSGLSLPEIGQQDTGDGTMETRGEMMKTAFQTQSNFTVAKQKPSLAPSGGGKIGSDIVGFTSAGSTHGDLRNIINGGNRTNQGMFGFSNENAANLMTMTSEMQPGIFKQNQFALSQPSMSQLSKSQSRMTAQNITGSAQNPPPHYLQQQHSLNQNTQQTKFKQKAKRLKTTQAQRALNESEFIQNNAVRKAAMGIQSRQQQQSMTAAGFEGLQMMKGSAGGIFGGSQSGKKTGMSEQLLGQTTQMHLNINLNQ